MSVCLHSHSHHTPTLLQPFLIFRDHNLAYCACKPTTSTETPARAQRATSRTLRSECLLLKPGRSKRRYMSQHLLLLSSARRNGVSVRIRATVGSITFFEHTFHRYRTHYMHGRNTLLLTIPRLYSAGLLLTIPRLYSAGLHTSINNFMSLSKHSAQHGDRSSSNWQCTAI